MSQIRSPSASPVVLAESRKALLPIIVPAADLADRLSPVRFAAKELRYYLGRITAAPFELRAADGTVSAAAPAILLAAAAGLDAARLGDDGFAIKVSNGSVRIAGGRRGVLYGVYGFLERLGCRFFTCDCEKVPTAPRLAVPEMDVEEKPVFEYRGHNYADAVVNPRFAAKCRFNGHHNNLPPDMGGSMRYALFVHTFKDLVPASEYASAHPEYFALVDGRRDTGHPLKSQLCLTNPDVLRIATENVRRALLANPGARIVSISQNDWPSHCECDACRAIDEEEGSAAGSLLRFVNAIAEALEPEFPDVVFDTLAYQYSRPAPRLTRNRRNVCVRLCSIECCFSHPMETCDDATRGVTRPDGSRSSFIEDLREWGRVCDRVYVWDYSTGFAHYPAPHPNWRTLQPNLQAMARNSVKGVYEQACGASRGSTDFNELRLYLISKLLWNPDCDVAAHRREFMEHYYGAAAPALDAYLNLLCDKVEEDDIHVGFNDNPVKAHFDEGMLGRYEALFDEAERAVAGDARRLWRVAKARLSLRWVRLKRAAMLRGELDPEAANRFFEDWRSFGLSRIDEWCNLETTHRALLEGKWRGVEYFVHWKDEEPEYL